jgi:RNA polymerase sigma-70 factor (ECF subfamily)
MENTLVAHMERPPLAQERLEDLEKTFRAHHALVYRAAYRVTGNASDAEDVLQTVFLRMLRRETDLDQVDNLESYLYRASVNAALDLVRSRQSAPSVPLDELRDVLPGRTSDSTVLKDWLRRAVGSLHPTAAQMFALRYFEGYDNPEVAAMMNTSQSVVAVTLHRARTRLLEQFRAFMGEQQ